MAIQIRTSLAEPDTGETFVPHGPTRPMGAGAFAMASDYEPAVDQEVGLGGVIGEKARCRPAFVLIF